MVSSGRAASAKQGRPRSGRAGAHYLAEQTEPRAAAEVATALGRDHPERNIKTTVVRTTLEGVHADTHRVPLVRTGGCSPPVRSLRFVVSAFHRGGLLPSQGLQGRLQAPRQARQRLHHGGGLVAEVDDGLAGSTDRPGSCVREVLVGIWSPWFATGRARLKAGTQAGCESASNFRTVARGDFSDGSFHQDGAWVPTFPNATYLIPRADNLYFDPEGPGRSRAPRDEHERVRWEGSKLVFNDSIAPIHRAGQAVLWEGTHRIDGNLTLEAAPGHTPRCSVLTLRSGTDRAAFVGDMLHSPVQVLEPSWNSRFCDDPVLAARTRSTYLFRAAETRELVIPAHWPGHGAAEVRQDGDGFALTAWADLPRH